MANITELNNIAKKNQIQPIHVYREYCQHLFLSFLYTQKKSDRLMFKGGTALRLAFGSPRYSEDLDFTLILLSNKEVEDIITEVLWELEAINISPHIKESKETTGGYLAELTLNLEGESVNISIQASRRNAKNAKPDVTLIENQYIPSYIVYLLEAQELIREKIEAAQNRKKPRDFFDIYFLLRANKIMPTHIKGIQRLLPILENEEIDFKNELTNFLPRDFQPVIKNFKDVFAKELSIYNVTL